MNTQVSERISGIQPTPFVLSAESADILQHLKKIQFGYFFKPDHVLINKLKVIHPIDLTNILQCLFLELMEKNTFSNPDKILNRLANLIPLTKIQEATASDMDDILAGAKDLFEEAKLYLEMKEGSTSPTFKARLSSILDAIISVIESVINAFGISDFFKPAESDLHADFKSQKIMMLLSIFSMITTMVLPILGAATGGLIIGGLLLGIAALSILWPLIKPKTNHLPANAENWTKQIQNGCFVAQGRKESLDEIANIIKMNRHALLVGPSRVGKSLTAKAFAQAIERGDYPELKGKTVFRINTTDIVGQTASFLGGGNTILNKISAAMGRHRNDIILVLDEIHMACKNNEKIADQLKTFLDENGEFPHVIGITTEEEYENYVKDNTAFSLRFDRVNIENTCQDETLKILGIASLKSHSNPIIKEDALDQIYAESCKNEDAPQPATSIKIFKRCIHKTEKTQRSSTEKKITEVYNKISSLRALAAATRGRKKDVKDQINELEKQMKELQQVLAQEQKEINNLFKFRELLTRITKETYRSVIKISTIAQKKLNPKNEKQLKLFLLQKFLGQILEEHIEETAKNFDVRAIIDKELVIDVMNENTR